MYSSTLVKYILMCFYLVYILFIITENQHHTHHIHTYTHIKLKLRHTIQNMSIDISTAGNNIFWSSVLPMVMKKQRK